MSDPRGGDGKQGNLFSPSSAADVLQVLPPPAACQKQMNRVAARRFVIWFKDISCSTFCLILNLFFMITIYKNYIFKKIIKNFF